MIVEGIIIIKYGQINIRNLSLIAVVVAGYISYLTTRYIARAEVDNLPSLAVLDLNGLVWNLIQLIQQGTIANV
jgi:hypothetical protein